MKNIRLLPVVVMAVSALLVLKTVGLVTHGGYVLGVSSAQAAGDAPAADHGAASDGAAPDAAAGHDATMEDTSPTLADPDPTLAPGSADAAAGGHGAPAAGDHGEAAEADHEASPAAAPAAAVASTSGTYCLDSDATIAEDGTVTLANPPVEGGDHAETAEAAPAPAATSFAASMTECLPTGDAVPVQIDGQGGSVALINADGSSLSEQQLLERLSSRRTELEKYEQDLTLRSSLVDAAEKRIAERAATLEALEAQISSLVDQRTEMESGQFAGIVAMYETMKPKDAAGIFNALDIEVLLRVAKTMSPRKMAPILAEMDTARAQELTVKMAALADQPADQISPQDLSSLPQIVGQ